MKNDFIIIRQRGDIHNGLTGRVRRRPSGYGEILDLG